LLADMFVPACVVCHFPVCASDHICAAVGGLHEMGMASAICGENGAPPVAACMAWLNLTLGCTSCDRDSLSVECWLLWPRPCLTGGAAAPGQAQLHRCRRLAVRAQRMLREMVHHMQPAITGDACIIPTRPTRCTFGKAQKNKPLLSPLGISSVPPAAGALAGTAPRTHIQPHISTL
jgi:hypothetical protein